MVGLDVVFRSNSATVKSQPLVAVFVGGTSGIGEYTIRELAETHGRDGPGLRLYIVGRNEASAKTIISDCLEVCPAGQFIFVAAQDLSLLKDVDAACARIKSYEEEAAKHAEAVVRIDLLVLTAAHLAFEPRRETAEGLDKLVSLLYYSRMRMITQLLPLLLAASSTAHIISVFGPQRNDKLFQEDLSLRNPSNYSFMNMGSHVAYLTTFFMEHLAAEHPEKLSLTHYFPGLVVTNSFYDPTLPWWLRYGWKVASPLSRLFTVPAKECGQRVLFHMSSRFPARPTDGKADVTIDAEPEVALSSDGMVGGGAYRSDWNGEIIPLKPNYGDLRSSGLPDKMVKHTLRAFEVIEAGHKFIE